MKKVAIVYWSGTGNTQAMAEAVTEGAKNAGAEADLFVASEFKADMIADYAAIGFGCSAMGDEVLEESEFEPMFEECEGKLGGKRIGLFGSYGWGDGQWMRDWNQRCDGVGAVVVDDPIICADYPNEETVDACKDLGKLLAK